MVLRHSILFPALGLVALACTGALAQDASIYSNRDRVHPVWAASGMVASQEAVATAIGVDVLKAGGNAVDRPSRSASRSP